MTDIWDKTYRANGISTGEAEIRTITAISHRALTGDPVAVCEIDINVRTGRTTSSIAVDITADQLESLAAKLKETALRAREMTALAEQLKQTGCPPVGSDADPCACAANPPAAQALFSGEAA